MKPRQAGDKSEEKMKGGRSHGKKNAEKGWLCINKEWSLYYSKNCGFRIKYKYP